MCSRSAITSIAATRSSACSSGPTGSAGPPISRSRAGPELVLVEARDGTIVAVFTVLGRAFMKPVDCPFRAADRVLERIGGAARVIVVDVHAEATSDKQLLGRYLDGRVSAVLGTHTHVPTADEQILRGGTAFQADVGMTGSYDSILGRRVDRVLAATLTFIPHFFEVASGDPRLGGAARRSRCGQRPRPEHSARHDRRGRIPPPAHRLTASRASRSSPCARPRATAVASSNRRPSTKCQRTQCPPPSSAADRSNAPISAVSTLSRGRIAA